MTLRLFSTLSASRFSSLAARFRARLRWCLQQLHQRGVEQFLLDLKRAFHVPPTFLITRSAGNEESLANSRINLILCVKCKKYKYLKEKLIDIRPSQVYKSYASFRRKKESCEEANRPKDGFFCTAF